MNTTDRRVGRLTRKVTITLILFGIILTTSIGILCYYEYTHTIEGMYHKEASQIGNIVNSFITDDFKDDMVNYQNARVSGNQQEIERTKNILLNSPDYSLLKEEMETFRNNMNISQIFLCDFHLDNDAGEFTYIMDIVNPEVVTHDEGQLGEQRQLSEDNYKVVSEIYNSGEQSDEIFSYRTRNNYSVAAIVPVKHNGNVIGIIGVEDPMLSLETSRRSFLIRTVIIAFIITVIVVLAFTFYNRKYFLNPLHKIINETKEFINNPEKNRNELDNIKSNDDIEILAESVTTLENDINSYIKHIERVATESAKVEADLETATRIQHGILPNTFPPFPEYDEFDIYAVMETAKEVGGDFYDFFLIDNDHLGLVIADVSGKGIPAALFMAMSKTLIKIQAQNNKEVIKDKVFNKIFENVNNSLYEGNEGELFVTALLGVYEISTGKLTFVNAGHNPPAILRENKEFKFEVIPPDLILAVMPDMEYSTYETSLKPGDKLFLYTDGVTEAQNLDQELYGEERLLKILTESKDQDVENILRSVRKDIADFTGKAEQFDDITMLCFAVRK